MKKFILVSTMFLMFAGVVSASSINGEYKGNPIVLVKSDGKVLDADEVPGQIIDGHTMVPISMLRQLGASVTWDASTYSVNVKLPQGSSSSLADTRLLAAKFNAKFANVYKLIENSSIDIIDYTTYMSNYFNSHNQKLPNATTDESLTKSLQLVIDTYNLSSDKFNEIIKEYPNMDFSDARSLLSSNYNAIEDLKNGTTYLFNWNYFTMVYDFNNSQTNFNNYLSKTSSASNAAIANKYKSRIGYNKYIQSIIQ